MDKLYGLIKIIGIWGVILTLMTSCGITRPTVIRDSTITHINYLDSITYRDSTVIVPLYKEYYNTYTDMLDTLHLETSLAAAKAYLDTTNKKLKGDIANKDSSIPYKIKWKERTVYKDSIVYVKEEVPVPYPEPQPYVPKFYKFCLVWLVLSVLGIAAFVYFKFFTWQLVKTGYIDGE